MNNEKEELSTSMSRAYDQSLRPFHGFMIRPLFKVGPGNRSILRPELTGSDRFL